jgi:hypothetical protein
MEGPALSILFWHIGQYRFTDELIYATALMDLVLRAARKQSKKYSEHFH